MAKDNVRGVGPTNRSARVQPLIACLNHCFGCQLSGVCIVQLPTEMSLAACTRHVSRTWQYSASRQSLLLPRRQASPLRSLPPWRSLTTSAESQHKASSGSKMNTQHLAYTSVAPRSKSRRSRSYNVRHPRKGTPWRAEVVSPILQQWLTRGASLGETATKAFHQPHPLRELYIASSVGYSGQCNAKYVQSRMPPE